MLFPVLSVLFRQTRSLTDIDHKNDKETYMSFNQFSIDPRCQKLLKTQKITVPTPIQEQAIPVALDGRDVVGIAQTGTGKTLGFTLPSLTHLSDMKSARNRMLVITPTRELANQVNSVIKPFAKTLGLHSVCLYGGTSLHQQTKSLKQGCAIIVATPGRLLDHMKRGNVSFNKLSILVLDEADRMLDMGFLPDIKRIVATLPEDRQTLMFSATFPKTIERMASTMLYDPVRIEVGRITKPVDAVRQEVYTVTQTGKLDLLSQILREPDVLSALVFIRTKRRTERVSNALHKEGFNVQSIHGDRSQSQRDQAIMGFRKGRYKILVATDVAARGIDVQGITHVVNFDIPANSDDYIHRIGRTARANEKGDAITFVSPNEHLALNTIESALGKNLPRKEWEGCVPVLSLFNPDRKTVRKGRRGRSLLRRR